MMPIADSARQFFDACETGKGWSVCKAWCHEGATFSCQANALADTTTLEAYTEWAKDSIVTPLPGGHYELKAFANDRTKTLSLPPRSLGARIPAMAGPVAPTGKSLATGYVYVMKFDGDKIRHMTKVWNDVQALKALGWACTRRTIEHLSLTAARFSSPPRTGPMRGCI